MRKGAAVKVRLDDIPPEGLEVEFRDNRATAGDLGPQVCGLPSAPWVRVCLERRGDLVLGKGRYRSKVEVACSRCLRPGELDLEGPVEWLFRPPEPAAGDEIQLGEDELDVTFYQDGELDLAQALRDELGLALPIAPLCRDDCPGLCPACGKPLEDGACQCRPREIDPRWAKLAELDKQ